MLVRIKTYSKYNIPGFWDRERMPLYMGRIVTIRCRSHAATYSGTFHIKEDHGVERANGWHWRDIDFIKVNTLEG